MTFRFRLTFHHAHAGYLRFEETSKTFKLQDGTELTLTARDADKLSEACRFHFEVRGFPNKEVAKVAGEHLRLSLRVLNSLLGLGITVPVHDTTGARYSQAVKDEAFSTDGSVALDSIVGLYVFPDDESYVEYIADGRGEVYPSDPDFIFRAIDKVWPIDMKLNDRAGDSLQILNRSTSETSIRTKFLLTYLAAERMIDRPPRSESAKALIKELYERVRAAGLPDRERDSLCGSLAQLSEHSFASALFMLEARMQNPPPIKGKPIRTFLLECVKVRNRLAHSADIGAETNLQELADGLRQFIMMLIWTTCNITDISIDMPPSGVSFPTINIRVR